MAAEVFILQIKDTIASIFFRMGKSLLFSPYKDPTIIRLLEHYIAFGISVDGNLVAVFDLTLQYHHGKSILKLFLY